MDFWNMHTGYNFWFQTNILIQQYLHKSNIWELKIINIYPDAAAIIQVPNKYTNPTIFT
jgi:hypothetical protein